MGRYKYFFYAALWVALVIFAAPVFLVAIKPKVFPTFFDAFDKISIPVFIGFYCFFWLRFKSDIKIGEAQLLKIDKTRNLKKKEQIESGILYSKEMVEYVDYTLRLVAILGAAIKIIGLFL